jgi:hypothetical protein
MPRRGPTTVDTRPSRHHQPPIRAHRGTTNRRSAPVGSTMRAAKHRILLHVPRACWTLARCGSMHVTIYHRMLDIGARRGSLHVPIYRDVAHAGHWRASWIIARPDISRRRACWTSARRGSLHVPIYRDVAHAGHWRVVDQCTHLIEYKRCVLYKFWSVHWITTRQRPACASSVADITIQEARMVDPTGVYPLRNRTNHTNTISTKSQTRV